MLDPAARRPPTVQSTAWLKVLAPANRLAFYADAPARAAALPHWGVEFPEEPCRSALDGSRASLWVGPDEYLLLDWREAELPSGGPAVPALRALEEALFGIPHALVDISHRQFAIEVGGPHATTVLSAACPLDLDLAEFPVGMCTRTVLAKADIVLWRTRDDAFHLEVWRSFAGYVSGLLSEIAAEFHP
jgi:sarcosine oxidase subunit gamma